MVLCQCLTSARARCHAEEEWMLVVLMAIEVHCVLCVIEDIINLLQRALSALHCHG